MCSDARKMIISQNAWKSVGYACSLLKTQLQKSTSTFTNLYLYFCTEHFKYLIRVSVLFFLQLNISVAV